MTAAATESILLLYNFFLPKLAWYILVASKVETDSSTVSIGNFIISRSVSTNLRVSPRTGSFSDRPTYIFTMWYCSTRLVTLEGN